MTQEEIRESIEDIKDYVQIMLDKNFEKTLVDSVDQRAIYSRLKSIEDFMKCRAESL